MKTLLPALSLVIALAGPAALPGIIATAQAEPVMFEPDWPNHQEQAEQTICLALAQGWPRTQIVDVAEHANDIDQTGLSVPEAARLVDTWIDEAHNTLCPTLALD
ncbi:hypothetical protein PR370_05250 [Mycobacterium marinum]|uniref:hypothetical protein n=1 Tax=Mycobacterium marinum TaxID=1781 RepID=UPI0023587F0A|nr:hypothetical protein [Mycobacterium marinum]MDC8981766.1 hypothetical protein [Mycobacterium marinum]MDC8998227.1 hypothetical protein [Mycobacterium marinum]MDC9009448.1 hypothetical protein [Mycobacterium marinum]